MDQISFGSHLSGVALAFPQLLWDYNVIAVLLAREGMEIPIRAT
jgi:hypothetical protein